MTTSLVPSLRPLADGGVIPESTRAFFRERIRIRLHQFLLAEFLRQSRERGLTRKALAERIERRPESITRWLNGPGNMELDTLSDLLLAMGMEPTFSGRRIVDQQAVATEPVVADVAAERVTPTLVTTKLQEPATFRLRATIGPMRVAGTGLLSGQEAAKTKAIPLELHQTRREQTRRDPLPQNELSVNWHEVRHSSEPDAA